MPEINSFPINTKTFEELDVITDAQSTDADGILFFDESVGVMKRMTRGELFKNKVIPLDSIAVFPTLDVSGYSDRQQFHLNSFAPEGEGGGGSLLWASDLSKLLHDGIKYFSPTVPIPADFDNPTDVQNYRDGVGEEFPADNGIFVLTSYSIESSETPTVDNALVLWDGLSGTRLKNGPLPTIAGTNLIKVSDAAVVGYSRLNADNTVSRRTLTEHKTDLSINNVDNTSDANKPISSATQAALDIKANSTDVAAALALKAPLASPALTGTPTVPTAAANTNTTQAASTAYVQGELTDRIQSVATIADLQALTSANNGQTFTVQSGTNTGEFIYNSSGSGSASFNNIVPDTLPGRFEKIDSSSAQVIIDAVPQRLDNAIDAINTDLNTRSLTTLTNATVQADANLFDLSEVVLSVPSGFPWTPSFAIYRDRSGVFCVDIDPKSLQPKRPTTKLWVDVVIGSDANTGLSPSVPFKTLLAALNSSTYTTDTGPCVIYINDGFYAYDQSMSAGLIIRPTSLIGIGGKPRITGAQSGASPTWTQQSSPNANVYSANLTAASAVWDSSITSDNGYFYRYTSVASVVACQALPGSFYFTGTVLYVHALSGIQPGAEIYINRGGNGHVSHTTTAALYCENISFELANTFNFNIVGSPAAQPSVFNKCDFLYMQENGLYTNRNGNIYLFDCHAGNNGRDGFNYEGNDAARTQNILEVNCRAIKNGWDTTGSNNGSTSHFYTNIINVNCYYDRNADRQVHDVDDAYRWSIGTYAGRSTNGSVTPWNNFCFGAGRETGDSAKMWLDSCTTQDGAVALFCGTGSELLQRRMSTKTQSGGGTFTQY